MTSEFVKKIAKVIWLLAVAIFVFIYGYNKREALYEAFNSLDWYTVLLAIILVSVAKLGLVINMQLAARKFSINLNFRDSFRIYNLTQLAKYIPGSIWQFIGRIAILRERDIDNKKIRDSLLAEHFWVLLVATVLGIILILLSPENYFFDTLKNYSFNISPMYFFIFLFGLSIVLIFAVFKRKLLVNFNQWALTIVPTAKAVILLFVIWWLFGSSLWITLQPFVTAMPTLSYITAIYCIAYVFGFIVPFAPAGLGVREAILVLALAPVVGAEVGLLLAGVNRAVYFFTELLMALFCLSPKSTVNP